MSFPTKFSRLFGLNSQIKCALRFQERQIHRWVAPTLRELKKRKDKADFKQVIPKLPNPRCTYLEWNQEAELFAFGKRLKENFDPQLLKTAFIHRSYIIQEELKQRALGIENPDIKLPDNRDLIQEGEAFLLDYLGNCLQAALPRFPAPGILCLRDHLMKTEVLATVAAHLGCKDLIQCQENPITDVVLAKTLKAIVAALARSSGSDQAAHFVRDFILTCLNDCDINDLWTIEHPLEMLTRLLKESGAGHPEFRLIEESAKNTILACFRVGIYVDKEMFCQGFGENLTVAKDTAAREGLKVLFHTEDNMSPANFRINRIPEERSKAKLLHNSSI